MHQVSIPVRHNAWIELKKYSIICIRNDVVKSEFWEVKNMYRIYIALIEIVAAAVFIIPIWCVYNKLYFRSWKMTILYMVFGFYLTAVLALVGFPNIMSLKVELTVNIIPFVYMIDDFVNACLNVLLFVPFGFFLPVLWKEFRNAKKIFIAGFAMTSFIEIAQIFKIGRAHV